MKRYTTDDRVIRHMSDAMIDNRIEAGLVGCLQVKEYGIRRLARFRPPVADAAEVRHNSERSFVELTGLSTPLR